MKIVVPELNRPMLSLLLYLETRAVDFAGRVDGQHVNDADRAIMHDWNETGFVRSGRIRSADVTKDGASWCQLSAAAFTLAHKERRARAKRNWACKLYQTTEEKREEE